MIAKAFPDKLILQSIGNNDVLYHNQAPSSDEKGDYYGSLWKIWFEGVESNKALADNLEIKSSFSNGGYFAYDLPGLDFTVISLNAMYPMVKNKEDKQIADDQLTFLEETLSRSDNKFLIMTHVYPANWWYKKLQVFWEH